MASEYNVNFTDQDFTSQRTFQVAAYTSNGPDHPNTTVFSGASSSAATSLLLYGKGITNYGERIQENLIHLLENFSSTKEPTYPVSGQLWYDTSGTAPQLRVYNDKKYLVVVDIDNAGVAYIALNPPSPSEQAEMLARFVQQVGGIPFKVRIHNVSGEYNDYLLNSDSVINGAGLVALHLLPTPTVPLTTGVWYVGGWEYVLQNNTKLKEDLDADSLWTLTNLLDPTGHPDSTIAATKGYVDAEVLAAIGGISNLGALTDVTLTAPAANEVLMYNGAVWANVDASSLFLSTSGGTVTGTVNLIGNVNVTGGILDLGGNIIDNVASPFLPPHAATKGYVDAQITAISSIANINDLLDVTLSVEPPVVDSLLFYSTSTIAWIDVSITDFITNNNLAQTTGFTMTGQLILSANPTIANEAATKLYVDDQDVITLTNANAYTDAQIATITNDGVVDGGSYSAIAQELTLTRTEGLPNIVISGFPTGSTSDAITHTIGDPNDLIGSPITIPLNDFSGGLAFEEWFYKFTSYPDVTIEEVLREINITLGEFVAPKRRVVFASNGNGTVYLGDTSGGAEVDQTNPTGDLTPLNLYYHVGSYSLGVYVNGIKQYASDAGYQRVTASTFKLLKGTKTGLTIGNPYNFDITVNGGTQVNVAITGVLTMGELVNEINDVADAQYWQAGVPDADYQFGCLLLDGDLIFYSGNPGTGSSIALSDVDLFSSLVGDAGTTGTFTVALGITNDANYLPTDLGYTEVGRIGEPSDVILFTSNPPVGAVIEIIVDQKLLGA